MLIKRSTTHPPLASRAIVVWRLITFTILGTMAASVLLSSYFIYVHIYQALNLTSAITVLSSKTSFGIIDQASYQAVEDKIQSKQTLAGPPAKIRDPFVFPTSTLR